MHTLNSVAVDGELLTYSSESGIPNFLSGALFAAAAVAAALAARDEPDARPVWAGLAVVAVVFALEEAALDIHNSVEDALGDLDDLVLIAAPLAVLAAAYLLRRRLEALPSPVPLLLISAVLSFVGAQLCALLAAALRGEVFKPRNILIVGEEAGEMLAASLMLSAAVFGVALARSRSATAGGSP